MRGKKETVSAERKLPSLGHAVVRTQYGVSVPLSNEGTVRCLRMTDLINGRISLKESKWVSLQERNYRDYLVKSGDILFNRTNSLEQVGKVALARSDMNAVFASYLVRIVPNSDIVQPAFLLHLLTSTGWQSQIRALATKGVSQCNVNVQRLLRRKVFFPIIARQFRISTLLDSLDDVIENTRDLVNQTERLKSALAQDLLVHAMREKRSPVHPAKLGQLFSERTERGRPGLPTISVTMNDGIMDREDMDRRIDSALTPEEHLLAKTGDLAYNMMRMWQGVSGLVPQDSLVSPAYVVVTPGPNIDAGFAAHFFKLPETIRLFRRYSQGLTDDRLRLYFDQFAEIPVTIPKKISDQKRIARLLDTMDEAVAKHESTLAALIRAKTAISNEIFEHP